MSEFNISVPGGESKRLKTGGKYCPADIVVNAEKSAPVVEKDVNFWDYDGTLLYSYTLEELQSLTELPPNAQHEGLIGDGWNWTLENLKENNGPVDVAALYVTEDGATWFDLENNQRQAVEVSFLWKQTAANGAVIDFGDGSEPYRTNETGDLTVTHSYPPGAYRAKISGSYSLRATSSSSCVNDMAGGGSYLLKRVFFGRVSGCTYAFKNCVKLESYTIPINVLNTHAQTFYNCVSLKFTYFSKPLSGNCSGGADCFTNVSIPLIFSACDNISNISDIPNQIRALRIGKHIPMDNTQFVNNAAIAKVTITEATKSLATRAFQNCTGLTELVIPENVQTINAYAFNSATNLRYLRFESLTPPTVANANAFTGVPTFCVVEVPAESLTAYQQATNYGTIAAQMVGV